MQGEQDGGCVRSFRITPQFKDVLGEGKLYWNVFVLTIQLELTIWNNKIPYDFHFPFNFPS